MQEKGWPDRMGAVGAEAEAWGWEGSNGQREEQWLGEEAQVEPSAPDPMTVCHLASRFHFPSFSFHRYKNGAMITWLACFTGLLQGSHWPGGGIRDRTQD